MKPPAYLLTAGIALSFGTLSGQTRETVLIDDFNQSGTLLDGQDYGFTVSTDPPASFDCCRFRFIDFDRSVPFVWGGKRETTVRNTVSQTGGTGTLSHHHNSVTGLITTTVTNNQFDQNGAFLFLTYQNPSNPVKLGNNARLSLRLRQVSTSRSNNLLTYSVAVNAPSGGGSKYQSGEISETSGPVTIEVPLDPISTVERISVSFGEGPNANKENIASQTIEVDNLELSFDEITDPSPTDLSLSNHSLDENLPAGTLVGTFAAVDPDAGETFTFTLVNGVGESGNSSFTISNINELRTAAPFDADLQSGYSIRVRVTDGTGLFYEKPLTISIIDDLTEDVDGDGLTEQEEDAAGTSDLLADTDDDGATDPEELAAGTDPNDDSSYPLSAPTPGGSSQDVLVSFGKTGLGGAWNVAGAEVMNSANGLALFDSRLNATPLTLQGFVPFSNGFTVVDASHPLAGIELGFGWNGGQEKGWIHPFAVNDFIFPGEGEELYFKISGLDPAKKYSLEIVIAHPTLYSSLGVGLFENPFSAARVPPHRIGLPNDTSTVSSNWRPNESWDQGGWVIWDEIQVGNTVGPGTLGINANDLVIGLGGFINALRLHELEPTFSETLANESGDTTPAGDLNGDGVPNAITYALRLPIAENLTASDRTRLPSATLSSTGAPALGLGLPSNLPDDVTLCVEASSTLDGSWTEIARKTGDGAWAGEATITEASEEDSIVPTTISYPASYDEVSIGFMRLRVDIAEP